MTTLPRPSSAPCGSCPYRRDVPAGIWHPSEYLKLPDYDGETWEQSSSALFYCHQNDGHLCAGWIGCHKPRELLALRLHGVAPETFYYSSPVALFRTGAEAAEHGLSGVANPDKRAQAAIKKLAGRQSTRKAK